MEVLLPDICEYIRNTKNYISLSDFIVEELEGIFPPIGSLIDYYTEIDGHRDNRTLIISGYSFDSKGSALLKGHNRDWKLVSKNGQKSKKTRLIGIKIPLNKVLKHIFFFSELYLARKIERMEKGQITIPSNAKFAAYTSKGLVIYGDFSIEYCKNMLREYNIKSSLIYWEEEVKDMSSENKLTLKIGSDGNIQNCVIGTIPGDLGYGRKPFTDCPNELWINSPWTITSPKREDEQKRIQDNIQKEIENIFRNNSVKEKETKLKKIKQVKVKDIELFGAILKDPKQYFKSESGDEVTIKNYETMESVKFNVSQYDLQTIVSFEDEETCYRIMDGDIFLDTVLPKLKEYSYSEQVENFTSKNSPKFSVGQTAFFNAGPRNLSHYVDSELLKNLSSKVKESIMKAIIKTYGIEKCIITQVKLEGNYNTPMEYTYEVNLPAKYNEISVHADTIKKEKELFPEKDLEIIDYILKGIKDKELVTKEIISRTKDFFETVLN